MRTPLPFHSLPKLALKLFLILFTGSLNFAQAPRFAQQSSEIIPSYRVGALAVFPESYERAGKIEHIYFRSLDGGDQVIWVIEPQSVLLPDLTGQSPKIEAAIGFFVPELPRGKYTAWYQSSPTSAPQSMNLAIAPALLTDQGVYRVAPGNVVEVRIKISSPKIFRRDAVSPQLIKAAITLKSNDPAVADLTRDQTAIVSTNREGLALWRIQVSKPGIAEFTGTAEGFDPVTVIVVGMPSAAPTFLEAALQAARLRAQETEMAASDAFAQAADREREARDKAMQASDKAGPARAHPRKPFRNASQPNQKPHLLRVRSSKLGLK